MAPLGPTDEVVAVWRESLASGRDPLHNLTPEKPDAWWACSAPERPVDDVTCFDYRCRPCWLMAEAAVRADPLREVEATDVDGAHHGPVPIAEYLRVARVFHGTT
jgi:hypothetical protein